ncbi:MAG: proteasome subunit beta, partial [Nitrospirae bacterium]|nr:proteasome subunit beta [Nitrospirota bacterium]
VVIPIFAGYDLHKGEGRIFKYDVTGGRYEEIEHYATGSGGKDARNTLKKRYQSGLEEEAALRVALEALYDAAEEDVGTGGPDMVRGIYPTAKVINGQGIMDAESQRVEAFYRELLEQKNTKRSGE